MLPKTLEGQANRNLWGDMFTKFYADLYGQDDQTMTQALSKLRRMKAQAMKDSTKLESHPNDLRDIGLSIFPNRAAGRDGLPSNVIRNLPYSRLHVLGPALHSNCQ